MRPQLLHFVYKRQQWHQLRLKSMQTSLKVEKLFRSSVTETWFKRNHFSQNVQYKFCAPTNAFHLSHFFPDNLEIDFFIIAKRVFKLYKTIPNEGKRVKAT